MEGLRRNQDRIRFVLVQHEESAAFMATGYAKATGRLGVCLATSGPGGLHLINGLYDARLDTGAKDRKPALELVRRAEIVQTTGEDWPNVALGVSTVRTER